MKQFRELIKVIDLEPFHRGEGDLFRFRIEIFKWLNSERYGGRVYRFETYRLSPTFPLCDDRVPNILNDALIYIADDMFDEGFLIGKSPQEVIEKFSLEFERIFGSPSEYGNSGSDLGSGL